MPRKRSSATAKAPRARVKSAPGAADNSREPGAAGFAISELRRLIRLVQRTGIGELEVSSGGRTVRISAHGRSPIAVSMPAAPGSSTAPAASMGSGGNPMAAPATEPARALVPIKSPMVGTFYRAPAPDADPYVEVGNSIEVGQTVCIIEAMKLMNEIESEVRGNVARVLVENAQPVEFGQELFLIEPL